MEDHDSGDVFPEATDEHEVFVTGFDQSVSAGQKIVLNFFDGSG